VVASTLRCSPVRCRQQSVDLRLFEIGNDSLHGLLERNRADLSGPFDMDRTVLADESRQGADGSEALVAGGNAAVTGSLEIREKEPDELSRDVNDRETIDRLAGLLCHEGDQLAERIAVAMLGVAGKIALGDDMLEQEAPDPRAKEGFVIHGTAPWHSVQSADLPGEAVPASA
jgi:hypothetical protein